MPTRRSVARVAVRTVERRIFFYRLDAGLDDAGRPLPLDLEPALACLDSLPFTPAGRYWEDEEGNAICCWVDQTAAPHRLRLGHIRRSGLPQVERAGALSALHLPAESGLVEQVHVMCFPDQIVGSEFNVFGPRVARLGQYLAAKLGHLCPPVAFEPLLRQDVAERLEHLRDVRVVRLRIRAAYAARVAQADRDLGEAFRAAQRAGDAAELELTLRARPYSRQPLAERLLGVVRHLAGQDDLRSEVSCFTVQGLSDLTGHVEAVDVLSDQLIARGQIICLDRRTRALDPASAYTAIEQAYAELRPQLLLAAGVRV